MKELKMGLGQDAVFFAYHEDAHDLYNVKMSLDKVGRKERTAKFKTDVLCFQFKKYIYILYSHTNAAFERFIRILQELIVKHL